jgi:3-hydroxybutyryl-CoA dehydrogenase
MGHGIAQEFAISGRDVALYDVDQSRLDAALSRIDTNLNGLAATGSLSSEPSTVQSRLTATTSLPDAVSNVDYVVEAAPEQLPLKQQLFADLDRLTPRHAILASNTSSFLPSLLASVTTRPDLVLVTHYFNPPHLVPLVEVVRGPETSDATVATIVSLLTEVGKSPVVMQREAKGFIGNRLQLALAREALSIVSQGLATPEDVDLVVRTSLGRRWSVAGPFEILDAAGLDTLLAVAEELFPAIESSPDIPDFLRDLVKAGHHGHKTGQGFYEWTPETAAALRDRVRRALVEIATWER